MIATLVTPPTLEPVTLSELRTQLNIDSGTIPTDMTPYSCLPSGSYPITYELLTLDVAPATAWAVGDVITGQTSAQTCTIVTVLTTKTFIVKSRSGAFTLGEIVGVTGTPAKLADQGAANPTFVTTYNNGYMALGTPIEVLGHTTVVYLTPVNNGTGGTVDCKIQECDTLTGTYTDWSGGGFITVTETNDTVIQEIAYTGAKKYIRTVAKVLVAACEFGTSIMVWEPNVSDDDFLTELIETARKGVEADLGRAIVNQTWDYFPKSWPKGDRIKIPFGNLQSVSFVKWRDTDGVETNLTKTITAFAASSVTPATKTKVTSAAHGFAEGDIVYIDGTTSYDGAWTISNVATNTFDITIVFVADDATGTVSEDYVVETNGDKCGFVVLPYAETWPSGTLFPSNPITIRFVAGYGATAASIPITIRQAIKRRCVNFYANRGDDVVGQTVAEDKTYQRLISIIGRLWDMDYL